MKSIGSFAAAVAAIWFLATLAVHAETTVDRDRALDFTHYATWNWMTGKPRTSQTAQRMLETAVEEDLGKKGFRKTEDEADFYVVAMAVIKTELRSWRTDFGGLDRAIKKTYRHPNGWAAWIPSQNEAELHIGTLVIHIYDAGSQEVVWSGDCTIGLSVNSKKSKKIDWAVARMLKSFSSEPHAQ